MFTSPKQRTGRNADDRSGEERDAAMKILLPHRFGRGRIGQDFHFQVGLPDRDIVRKDLKFIISTLTK